MCGISGVYNFKNGLAVDEKEVMMMRETLRHRGPDGEGLYVSPDKKVGFGHRRLAIIDLSPAGHQPMANEDGTVWIVFNGEIYNFQDLREELIKRGHTFKSKSDTEVVIHGYEEYGPLCVKRFNGMFAFVLWDEKKKLLFAARDHVGIKPFFYAVQNGAFYFGSEVKAILAHPSFKKEFEEKNAYYYLTFSCLPAPHTLFKDIRKIPAAHYLTIDEAGIIRETEYWNPALEKPYNDADLHDEQFVTQEVRRLLEDSIRGQMVSDVPFGCFLSGGIDSSTNAALMSRALGEPVETFSIGVEDYQKYNEFQYSREIARLLKAKTHERIVGFKDLIDFLPIYAKHADDPNGDYVCFPVFYLSQLIRESGVIVAQVGEGSDEIFSGYPGYLSAVGLYEKMWRPLQTIPSPVKATFGKAVMALMRGDRFDFQKTYLERFALSQEPFWGNAIAFSDFQKKNLLSPDFQKRFGLSAPYEEIAKHYRVIREALPNSDFLAQLTFLELKIRLPEFLLARVDKMAMAHSIETRVPFLDRRLVELALHLPQDLKLKGGATKYVLKRAVSGVIPDKVIWRKKQGFGAPVCEWLRNPERARPLLNIIKHSKIRELGLLDYDYIDRLITAHTSGADNHTFRIWNLLTLSLWYDHWFG